MIFFYMDILYDYIIRIESMFVVGFVVVIVGVWWLELGIWLLFYFVEDWFCK